MLVWAQGLAGFPVRRFDRTILKAAGFRAAIVWELRCKDVNRLVLCFIAILLGGGIAVSQAPDEAPVNPEMERQELVNLELENARAIKLHNSTFFKSVYSEDFRGVTRYGEVLDKAAVMREVENMPHEFDSVVSTDAQVRMFRDTASVLSLRSEVGRINGKRFYSQYRVLRVYVNTPRGWRVVSQLETMLASSDRR
jgi:hypothetical protein